MELSRKDFLRAGAAAWTAGAFNIVPSTVFGANAPSNRINMALVGCGGQGCADMGGFLGFGDVVFRAVCDVNKKKTEKAKKTVDDRNGNTDCKEYEDFREVCDRDDIDAIIIGTPDHWHAYIGTYALAHGKDCYGEKPLTHDLKEGRALANAVKKYGRVWQTGSQQRSASEFRKAVELVRNGRIGKVWRVEVGLPGGGRGKAAVPGSAVPEGLNWDFWLGPAPERPFLGVYDWDWRWVLDWGGGQLMDWIGHHCDIAQWGLDRDLSGPVSFKGFAPFEPEGGIYDSFKSYHVECRYADGIEMAIASDVRGGCKWYGENGDWIWVNRGALEASRNSIKESKTEPGELHLESCGHQRDFIDAIKCRNTTSSDCEIAHRSASVGHLCQIALLTGREIRWDPATERILDDRAAEALLGRAPRGGGKLY